MNASRFITFVVPAYNCESTICRALGSFAGFEQEINVIVVDDGSADNTVRRVREISDARDNIFLIRNSVNIGAGESRRVGVESARSEYIGFLDADDYFKPGALESIVRAVRRHRPEVFVFGSICVDQQGKFVRFKTAFLRNKSVGSTALDRFVNGTLGTFAQWNKIYRSDTISDAYNFRIRCRQNTNEDALINIRVFSRAKHVRCCNLIPHRHVLDTRSAVGSSTSAQRINDVALTAHAIVSAEDFDRKDLIFVARFLTFQYSFKSNSIFLNKESSSEKPPFPKDELFGVTMLAHDSPECLVLALNEVKYMKWFRGIVHQALRFLMNKTGQVLFFRR